MQAQNEKFNTQSCTHGVKQQLCQLLQQLLSMSSANSIGQIQRPQVTNIDDFKQSFHARQTKLVTADVKLL